MRERKACRKARLLLEEGGVGRPGMMVVVLVCSAIKIEEWWPFELIGKCVLVAKYLISLHPIKSGGATRS